MSNLLDIIRYDNRPEIFLRSIKDAELELYEQYLKSSVDRVTLFPQISEVGKSDGDNWKVVFVTNIRKQDKDEVWWRIHQEKSFITKPEDSERMKVSALKQFIQESYNIRLNYIVPHNMLLSFTEEQAVVKCAYQWLSEEDRMSAIFSFLSPAEYVINKYMKRK